MWWIWHAQLDPGRIPSCNLIRISGLVRFFNLEDVYPLTMGFLSFYLGFLLLHIVAFVFFLPHQRNPLPLGMKTGYFIQVLITGYALTSAFSAIASVDGFLTFLFSVVMEVVLWTSIIVFGVAARALRLGESIWKYLDRLDSGNTDGDVSTAELAQALGNALEAIDQTSDQSRSDGSQTRSSGGVNDPGDDDISRFKEMYGEQADNWQSMKDKAFRNRK